MVSIVLLTTEEVLQKNVFWYYLDAIWATKELEPFEEIKQEHMFVKPLSRDIYYTKYPDIPRSESDEENSLSLNGFKSKHREWKFKICVRRFDAQRRNSRQSYLSSNDVRFTRSGLLSNENNTVTVVKTCHKEKPYVDYNKTTSPGRNNEKVLDFLKRIQESVPPPPIEDFLYSKDAAPNLTKEPNKYMNFNNIEILEYDDFVNNKMKHIKIEKTSLRMTPTLKTIKRNYAKRRRRVCKYISRSIYV